MIWIDTLKKRFKSKKFDLNQIRFFWFFT